MSNNRHPHNYFLQFSTLVTIILGCLFFCACQTHSPEPLVLKAEEQKVDTVEKTAVAIDTTSKTVCQTKDTAALAPNIHKSLTVIVKNLGATHGIMHVGVYGPHNKFPDPKGQLKEYKFKVDSDELTAEIDDLNYGELALALYQDINENGKIDKNPIGIPKEPYGFSNNYKPTIKAPSFKDCRFNYSESTCCVTISLIK